MEVNLKEYWPLQIVLPEKFDAWLADTKNAVAQQFAVKLN